MLPISRRYIVALAGLLGAIGVASAAAASHGGDSHLVGAAATIALAHAPVLLVLGLAAPPNRGWLVAAILIAVGAAAFCLDMGLRAYAGGSVVPLLAPLSGLLMIAGWLSVVGLAIFAPRT
jgi:uncharacterized membrane protein YgdD (TMEM256/DUF423 family)